MALKLDERQGDTGYAPDGSHDEIPGYDRANDGLDAYDEAFNTPDEERSQQHPGPDFERQQSPLDREALNAAEENPTPTGKGNEDIFDYLKNQGLMSDKSPGKGSWFGRHKKGVAGGSAAIITVFGFFSMAAPLKLQGVLSMLQEKSMVRVEGYIEKRAKKIILEAVMERMGVSGRSAVADKSIIKSIVKTMTANKYEERLAAKGIEFIKDANGAVRVRALSEAGKVVLGEKIVKNATEAEVFLEGIPVTKNVLRSIIREDMGVWGFMVRGRLIKWMFNYLGITKLNKQVDKNATPDEQVKAAAVEDITDSVTDEGKALQRAMDIMGNPDKGAPGTSAGEAPQPAAQAEAKGAIDQTVKGTGGVKGVIKETTAAIDTATSETISKIVMTVGEKIGSQFLKTNAKIIGSKLIPVYGWVVLGATAVVFAHWMDDNKDKVGELISIPAGVLMSIAFAKWQGLATQQKLGTLAYPLMNYYIPMLDGIEQSSLFTCVDKDWQKNCDQQGIPAYKKLNQTRLSAIEAAVNLMERLDPRFWFAATNVPLYVVARLIVNFDNAAGGFLMDALINDVKQRFDIATGVIRFFAPSLVDQAEKNAGDLVEALATNAMNAIISLMGLDINPLMGGNKIFDILLNGGVFSANRFGKMNLGFHKMSYATAGLQTQQYLAEQRDYTKSKGMLYALFSPDSTESVTSRLVNSTSFGGGPVNTMANAASTLLGLVKNTPSTLADIVSNKAEAATGYGSPEAIVDAVPYGLTDEEANAPVDDAVFSGDACKTDTYNEFWAITFTVPFSMCQVDTNTAQMVLCSIDESITESSSDCNPDTGGSSGSASATASTVATGTCPAGTTLVPSITKGWQYGTGAETSLTLCTIPGSVLTASSASNLWSDSRYEGIIAAQVKEIAVNSTAAKALLDAQQKSGMAFTASAGYRSLYEQCSITLNPGNKGYDPLKCPSWIKAVGGGWVTDTLYSNHMMGMSVDFDTASADWMRKCVHDATDGASDNRCYGWYDDVNQAGQGDPDHFTYAPLTAGGSP